MEMDSAAFVSGPGGIRVLVVEEDPSCLTTLTQILERRGYIVTAKASPEEGLRALRDNPEAFDLVMSVMHTQGTGIDGFELLKHAAERYPVILFSGREPRETVMRAMLGGACDFMTKPLRDEEMRNIWQHVLRRQMNAAPVAAANAYAQISDDVFRQDDRATKRGSAGLDHSDEGDSHDSQKQKKGKTTKKTMFNTASFVKAAEQLRGTEGYCPRGIRDLLVAQGVEVTTEQVTSHLEKYRRDCLTNHLSAMPMASSSYTRNYLTPGSLGFDMRSQGTTYINQRILLSNGASRVGCGVNGKESYIASQVGIPEYNGNLHGNANGYDYHSGNVNGNDNDYHYGNVRGEVPVDESMISASLLSNVAQPVHQAMSEGYGNGRGRLLPHGSMVSASLSSNLAQPVQQAMPTSLFPCNTIRQHAFPRISRLRYDGSTGGISMLPWHEDDGEDLLKSYLSENEVMHNTPTTSMTQGMQGDGAACQTSASEPQDLIDFFSCERSNGNGPTNTSVGSGAVTDGMMECEFIEDEIEKLFN